MKDKLTTDDWIKAGFRALAKGGPQAIRVEAIARGLKVSKGSFYWHFKDVPALKAAMLAKWTQLATDNVVKAIEAQAPDAAEQLRALIKVSTSPQQQYGGGAAEPAIRDWARYDADAAEALKAVDLRRLQFVRKLFKAHGVRSVMCTSYANILYGSLIGLEVLSLHDFAQPEADLSNLLELMLQDSL